MTDNKPRLGFIGLGLMGGPMAQLLAQAEYTVTVFDLDAAKMAAIEGAAPAESIAYLVANSDVVMTSVPSFEVAVKLGEDLLAYAREGQTFIEFSTITPSAAIELAQAYAEKGTTRLDVPVSGGNYGAVRGMLRMFVGGDEATARACWPIFEVVGENDRIVYCGVAGRGQVVKIINQVAMGLSNAIYLEVFGWAKHMGVDLDVVMQGVGGGDGWRQQFDHVGTTIKEGDPTEMQVKFVQLEQFTDDALKHGYQMPLTRALFEFCDQGERITTEEIYPAPSFWHELIKNSVADK
ncbi:NAD(P)-dependent oxidoreductase [Phototrophicus methaneseepsis]|uniref:NAD(P)-dependent oxidoreductase n=1 Tax=Phototrophicus methaneseepsis TaxID=2710758 RepID=A0A7S8IFL5_9CHLR|nr:NAD(P)-binding domain-containing protein [Phototrophicus methaneseepsis]QPC83731.1 NAD(P)-dependent oxidoreductase [Phototrophicus methaneseepsis]